MTRQQRERRWLKKWISILWAFIATIPTHLVVKCRRTFLEVNSKRPYPSSEREIKFRCCFLTFSIKREIRHFHVAVAQRRQRNVQKNVMHVQTCCLLINLLFFRRFCCRRVVGSLRACLHGGGGPQVGEVTRLSIQSLMLIWSRLHGRWGDNMRHYMDRRVTPPTRGPLPLCK